MTDQDILNVFADHIGINEGLRDQVIAHGRVLLAKADEEIKALHAKLAGETLRADQGWQRYEVANTARLNADAALAKAVPEGFVVVPKEPTFEMLRPHHEAGGSTGARIMANAYRAMIAAAPSPEGKKDD